MLISNCIIYGNSGINEITPLITNTNIKDNIIEGGYASGSNNYDLDPLFVSPALLIQAPIDASGFDYHVSALSPAIDKGDNAPLILFTILTLTV